MIDSRKSYKEYLRSDLLAWGGTLPLLRKPDGYILEKKLRKMEYLKNTKSKIIYRIYRVLFFEHFCRKVGASISPNCFGPGLYLPHPNGVIVHGGAKIGKNCKIQQQVTIGQTGETQDVAVIGDNVFIGAGAKIIGGIRVADGVSIGANAVVCKNISEPNTTWGGVPAKKISQKGSRQQLTPLLFK
jgi:serine O-acetyltransferase